MRETQSESSLAISLGIGSASRMLGFFYFQMNLKADISPKLLLGK